MKKTLVECALALRRGEVSSAQLVSSGSQSIHKHLHHLNAFLSVDSDEALHFAEKLDRGRNPKAGSMMEGVTFSIKDNFMMQNSRTTAGSRMLERMVSDYDATVVRRLRECGGVILGKTNMDEFGMGSSLLNSAYGPCQNPWQREGESMSPGGSSGGSAAAVAAHMSHGSIGSDTGGSVRQPASFCGTVGLKPTYGLLSRYGLISYASSMDCPGVMTRSVLDAAVMLEALACHDANDPTSVAPGARAESAITTSLLGPDSAQWDTLRQLEGLSRLSSTPQSLRGIRVGVPCEFHTLELDARITHLWNETLHMLQDAGACIVPTSVPSLRKALPTYYILACAEASSNLSRYDGVRYGHRTPEDIQEQAYDVTKTQASKLHACIAKSRGEGFGSETIRRVLTGTYVLSQSAYHDYYENAVKHRNLLTTELMESLRKVDCFLGPTTPLLPFLTSSPPEPGAMYYNDTLTVPANLAGLPAISVPAGLAHSRDEGGAREPRDMPVGMQVMGKPLDEALLVRIGLAIEQRAGVVGLTPHMVR